MKRILLPIVIVALNMTMILTSCGNHNGSEAKKIAITAIDTMDNDSGIIATRTRHVLYRNHGWEILVEHDDSTGEKYCYATVDGATDRLKFGNEYLDGGGADITAFMCGRNVFIVGDIKPNSNGWTTRFLLYSIRNGDKQVKFIDAGAAILFKRDEIVVARARLTNPDADCTANERWVMYDVHYNSNGLITKEDKSEYEYHEMKHRFGEELIGKDETYYRDCERHYSK